MIGHGLRARIADDRGFTLIELLVVMILVGILAALALAVFLNQQDKGRDADAKSNVTNLAHLVQACSAGSDNMDDYRSCDTAGKLGSTNMPVSSDAPDEIASGDCSDTPSPPVVTPPGEVRVFEAGRDCYGVLGTSNSGNKFWYVRHNTGNVTRDCTTRNQNGCPSDGEWAG